MRLNEGEMLKCLLHGSEGVFSLGVTVFVRV
jgi:mannose/fructose/N-acetylgalactosamine-specific phosphotransferase system component IIC